MRGKKLIQLLKVLDLLSHPNGATRKILSEKLGISDRSVSRTLTTLQELGFPVYDDRKPYEKEKRWYLDDSYLIKFPNIKIPDIELSYPEIISLCMIRGESSIFNGTEIDRHISSSFTKLMRFIPEKTVCELNQLKRIFISKSICAKDYSGKEEEIRILTESMLNQTACRIRYHTYYKKNTNTYEIGPLHFYENNGGLYCFAVKLPDSVIRSYAVERIIDIKPNDTDVTYPDDFDPYETLNSAFDMTHGEPVSVKLWFSENEARYIKEKTWSQNQHIDDHADGSLTLTMTTSGYRDVKRWVMSFGKEARVVEPEGMRREIEGEFLEILKNVEN